MPREYRHIQQYEKEIIELLNEEKTLREVNSILRFVKFVHTTDIYTNVFPIYIIKKKDVEDLL